MPLPCADAQRESSGLVPMLRLECARGPHPVEAGLFGNDAKVDQLLTGNCSSVSTNAIFLLRLAG